MDEIAAEISIDPLELRLQLLDGEGKQAGKAPESIGGAVRLKHVLKELKAKINYPENLPADEGIGIAVHAGQERTMPTWMATAAHVKVNRKSGKVDVKRITLVIDAGIIVHPDGALAQVEGSALWGLSMALHEGTRFEKGQVADVNLNTYLPLRMNDVPELDIHFIESEHVPTGLGEPGIIGVAPAIGNAVYRAVGVRLRQIPISQTDVLAALEVQSGKTDSSTDAA